MYLGCRDSELGREAEASIRKQTGNKEVHYLSLKMGSIEEVRKFASAFQKSKLVYSQYSGYHNLVVDHLLVPRLHGYC